jgi:phosphoglucosamine mutase
MGAEHAGGRRRLFGTDGIRGTANVEPMTSETAVRIGRAVAYVVKRDSRRHKIIIGKDTRLSGYLLESALTSGICSMGVDVLLVGPLPTPGIAFLTRSMRADAGVVISASHNAFQDNGIKFFGADGFKLGDEIEREVERLVLGADIDHLRPTAEAIGKAFRIDDAPGRYNVFLKSTFPKNLVLDGVKVAVDCAHGAAYRVAPEVLAELGAEVIELGVEPNGQNINEGCGALHPEGLAAAVRAHGADLGIALDGDADRAIFVDETGRVVDGDQVLAMLGIELHRRGRLPNGGLVATVMSNIGLEVALAQHGIGLVRVPVGDRYVVEEMLRRGFSLGGEQSGHVVFLEHGTTGDGLVTALAVLALKVESGLNLGRLAAAMEKFPQVLLNVPVGERRDLEDLPAVQEVIARVGRALGQRGRVLVRYSGTEPLVRVMVEGEQLVQVEAYGAEIAAALREHLGRSAA